MTRSAVCMYGECYMCSKACVWWAGLTWAACFGAWVVLTAEWLVPGIPALPLQALWYPPPRCMVAPAAMGAEMGLMGGHGQRHVWMHGGCRQPWVMQCRCGRATRSTWFAAALGVFPVVPNHPPPPWCTVVVRARTLWTPCRMVLGAGIAWKHRRQPVDVAPVCRRRAAFGLFCLACFWGGVGARAVVHSGW